MKFRVNDIRQRHRLRDTAVLENLIDVIASATGSLTNPHKLVNTLMSRLKVKTNDHTIGDYLAYLKEAFLFTPVRRWNPAGTDPFEIRGCVYAHNGSQFNVLEGATMPLGWFGSAELLMGRAFYGSIRDDETFSLLYCAGNSVFGRAWKLRNLVIRLPDTQKPVVAVDGRFASALEYENLWVSGFDPRTADYRSARGINPPHPRSVGIRGCAGSNYYVMTTWKNLADASKRELRR